jgi:hypothetical protein
MADRPVTAFPGPVQVPATGAGLKPEAIGVAQDTIVGMATLAAPAAAGARSDGLALSITAVPPLVIANATDG